MIWLSKMIRNSLQFTVYRVLSVNVTLGAALPSNGRTCELHWHYIIMLEMATRRWCCVFLYAFFIFSSSQLEFRCSLKSGCVVTRFHGLHQLECLFVRCEITEAFSGDTDAKQWFSDWLENEMIGFGNQHDYRWYTFCITRQYRCSVKILSL